MRHSNRNISSDGHPALNPPPFLMFTKLLRGVTLKIEQYHTAL